MIIGLSAAGNRRAIVNMATPRFPFLVVSPTMRVPRDGIGGTINADLAMREVPAA